MVLSMTGVGKSILRYADKGITIFIKTLNSKQLDVSTRLPLLYRERDLELRALVADYLVRGKVELSITLDDMASSLCGVQRINHEALQYYIEEFGLLQSKFTEDQTSLLSSQGIDLNALFRLPGVLTTQEQAVQILDEQEWLCVREGLISALEEVVAFRRQEGEMLQSVLTERIDHIKGLLAEVDIPEAERIVQIRQRLEEGLKKVALEGYDKGRLEQEMVYYIEKLDVNEEKDRLRHHLNYFVETLNKPEGQQGRTLGFIAQEIGREINTLGSKSNNAEMQQIVVKMKDELEQIKEQTLNVL